MAFPPARLQVRCQKFVRGRDTRGHATRHFQSEVFARAPPARRARTYPGGRPRDLPCAPAPRRVHTPRAAGPRGVPTAPRSPRLAAARRRDTGAARFNQHFSGGRNPSRPALACPVVHFLTPLPGRLCPARPSGCLLRSPSCVPLSPAAPAADLRA